MASRSNRYRQKAPAPLYVPSSGEDEEDYPSEAPDDRAHRYSTIPEDDYISPIKDRRGRYTYGQPTPRHESRAAAGGSGSGRRGDSYATTTQDSVTHGGGGGGGGRFRVRLHHTEGVLEEMKNRHLMAPSLYMALHTAEERGHSRTVHRSYDPEFNDMFDFQSSRPDRDALVCTLVALPVTAQGKERKVAECVVSLKNLMWGVEREVWVPMVRHAGTKYAYEQGEVKLSIYSDDFGVEELPTEEEETAFSVEAQRILRKYSPDALHRLDWIVGEHLMDGDQGLIDIRASYGPAAHKSSTSASVSQSCLKRSSASASAQRPGLVEDRTVAELSRRSRSSAVNRMLMDPSEALLAEPKPFVKVRVTVQQVADLTGADGAPLAAKSCYVTFRTRANEVRSKIHGYLSGSAAFDDESFDLTLEDPVADPIEVTVCAGGRCLGEAQIGLTNVEAGREKKVEILLVRAADTGDACPSGRLCITLRTPSGKQGYSSPVQWSKSEERAVRDRVQAYLWTYLRDDLHRLDAIVGTVDVPDAYMREWARTIGREPEPRHVSVDIREATALFDDDSSHAVFVRATCGLYTARTRTRTARGKTAVAVNNGIDLTVLNPERDELELMVIEEMPNGSEREVSRTVLGLRYIPRREPLSRTVTLIANACSRAAHARGQLQVDLVAQDFGVSARKVMDKSEFEKECESLMKRCAAEECHRVPYVVDTAGPDDDVSAMLRSRSVSGRAAGGAADEATSTSTTKATSSGVAPATSAPLTVRVIGFKQFRGVRDGCYVEAVVRTSGSGVDSADTAATPFLRTQEKKSPAPDVQLDISDDNEATTSFKYTPTSVVSFRVMRSRRFRKDQVLARADVAVANLICGEKNTLWIPLAPADGADASAGADGGKPDAKSKSASDDRRSGDQYDDADSVSLAADDKIRDNHLPKSMQRKAREAREANESSGYFAPPPTQGTADGVNGAGTITTTTGAAAAGGARGGLLGVELRCNAFPVTTVLTIDGQDAPDDASLSPLQAVTRDVSLLLQRYCPEKRAQAQSMIARCTSLQEAYREIRSEVCPPDVEATVYLHIDRIEMETMQGRDQESRGEIGVVASFGGEHQVTQKRAMRSETGASLAGNKLVYLPMRLDLPGPERLRVAPLQLALVPLTGNNNSWAFVQTTSSQGQSGNTNTNTTSVYPTGSGAYGPRGGETSRRRHRRSTLGGRNNLMNYINTDALEVNDEAAMAADRNKYNATTATTAAAARAGTGTGTATHSRSIATRGGEAVAVVGGLGTVQLSLRALLSQPLHNLGDHISVPIVSTKPSVRTSRRATRAAQEAEVIGQIEFHLSAPAFEEFPEWTHLASRSVLAEVDPAYVHYYVRRIGAYLRKAAPADLVAFHYGLFERDVASGSWPVSLYDWMLALLKRFRTREPKDFGPEPPLRFNPEEREARRQMESYYARQSAFAEPEPKPEGERRCRHTTGNVRSGAASRLEYGGSERVSDDDDDDRTPEKNRSRGRYTDPEEGVDPRTEPPRRASRKKQSQARPTYSF